MPPRRGRGKNPKERPTAFQLALLTGISCNAATLPAAMMYAGAGSNVEILDLLPSLLTVVGLLVLALLCHIAYRRAQRRRPDARTDAVHFVTLVLAFVMYGLAQHDVVAYLATAGGVLGAVIVALAVEGR